MKEVGRGREKKRLSPIFDKTDPLFQVSFVVMKVSFLKYKNVILHQPYG